jgi:hypothetical protein
VEGDLEVVDFEERGGHGGMTQALHLRSLSPPLRGEGWGEGR